jgi:hypothetical protein
MGWSIRGSFTSKPDHYWIGAFDPERVLVTDLGHLGFAVGRAGETRCALDSSLRQQVFEVPALRRANYALLQPLAGNFTTVPRLRGMPLSSVASSFCVKGLESFRSPAALPSFTSA